MAILPTPSRWCLVGQLFLLLTCCTLLNLPLLSPAFLPLHDSLLVMETAHYFHQELMHNGQFPLWIPAQSLGLPFLPYLLALVKPPKLIILAMGAGLGIEDSMWLFKIAVLMDQWILLTGIWLLARILFRHPATVFLVCLASTFLGLAWLIQYFILLEIISLLPLQMYLVVRGCRERESAWLLIAGGLLPFSAYFASLQFFVLFILFMALRKAYPWPWREILRLTPIRWAGWGWALGVMGAYLIFLIILTSGAEFVTDVENRLGPLVYFEKYLTYAHNDLATPRLLDLIAGLRGYHLTVTIDYPGWIVLVLAVYAFLHVRTWVFFGFGLATLAVLGIMAGGGIATLAYLFPGMQIMSHIGQLGGVLHLLLILCAGFGLDFLFRQWRRGHPWWGFVTVSGPGRRGIGRILTVIAGIYLIDQAVAYHVHARILPGGWRDQDAIWMLALALRLIAAGAAIAWWFWGRDRLARSHSPYRLTIPLALVMLVDMVGFHVALNADYPRLDDRQQHTVTQIFSHPPVSFQAERTLPTLAEVRKRQNFGLVLDTGNLFSDQRYSIHQQTSQWHTCHSAWKNRVASHAVLFFSRLHGLGLEKVIHENSPLLDAESRITRTLGCGSPVLRLVRVDQGLMVEDAGQAIRLSIVPQREDQLILRSAAAVRRAPFTSDMIAPFQLPPLAAGQAFLQVATNTARFVERKGALPMAFDWSYIRPVAARAYFLGAGIHGEEARLRMPRAWRLMASHDGRNWVLIDQVAASTMWHDQEKRVFAIDDSRPFSHYRLWVDAVTIGDLVRFYRLGLMPGFPAQAATASDGLAASAAPADAEPVSSGAHPATDPPGMIHPPRLFQANVMELEVTVHDSQGAWLVYADAYDPHWQGFVDGEEVEVMEADLAFKAIRLPAGTHQVHFTYRDVGAIGVLIGFTGISGLFVAGLLWLVFDVIGHH